MSSAHLDWELCRSFLAILREGSLSAAGRALDVAHPTIRRHLEELEAGLGASLFVRSPSGLAPTELALTLRDPAEAMESAFEQLVRTASGSREAIAGTVRITASEVVGTEVLPPMLARLQERYPGLVFELDLNDGLADVLRRDADLAIRMLRPTQVDLIARRVGTVKLGLFAHQAWLERHGQPESLDALIRARALIGYDRVRLLIEALAAQRVAAKRGDFGFRSDSNLAQFAAMRAGLGVAVCQLPIAARDPHLVQLFPEVGSALEIWLVSHPNLRGSARVRACLDALGAELAAYAGG
ncbi:LysR family transcriptional regulator [Alsobacter sp. SYSU M60028]|uniref:LysR family transcriptional regulator n=1 Tax=Alsobacter ponti TaxID=2962936 RepID=A0ABT1LHQ7_9HYPH|nr:LysR family transcriptional regulator [Alsobacter ponti]MCP8941042.1 LysR family transcriptional regulator [Alsobacter ponti]